MMNTITILTLCLGALAAVLGGLCLAARREAARLASDKALAEQKHAAERRAAEERHQAERREAEALRAAEKRTAERERAEAEAEIRRQIERRMEVQAELSALRASSEAEIASLRRKSAEEREVERLRREQEEETLRVQFRNLANDILGEQSRRFKESNKESLDVLLKPFRDNITEFRERVERIYSSENEQRGALRNELKNLTELNRRITAETTNLTNALKGNSKVQGDWGEMILETILESSNLIKGIHYDTQLNLKDAAGNNLRPDVVLYLPEHKQIVIDSKVSLTAFVGYVGAEDEASRAHYLAQHVASVRQHVRELGSKEYQKLLASPDFVIMFVPNEPAFLAALQADNTIWADAYDRKVIVSSPTNLFALLKLVDDLWKRNDQDKNTAEIAACALKLYDQLVAITSSVEGVGVALDKAQTACADAFKRLTSGNDNVVRVGERLRRTARLQTKRHHSAKTLEAAEAPDDPPEEEAQEA